MSKLSVDSSSSRVTSSSGELVRVNEPIFICSNWTVPVTSEEGFTNPWESQTHSAAGTSGSLCIWFLKFVSGSFNGGLEPDIGVELYYIVI